MKKLTRMIPLCCTLLIVVSCRLYEDVSEIVIQMPPTYVTENDTYLCHAEPLEVKDHSFVVGFQVHSNTKCTQYVGVGACGEYNSDIDTWDCGSQQGKICSGRSLLFGTWDDSGERKEKQMFADDVSVDMSKTSSLNYLITQIHYSRPMECHNERATNISLYVSQLRRPFTFQTVSLRSTGHIPPNVTDFHAESACIWKGITVYAYSYAVHTRSRGLFVEGYRVRDGNWTLIGSRKPSRRKERSHVADGPLEIRPGDYVAARCTFDNTGNNQIHFGGDENDEMCNFDIEFKYPTDDEAMYPTPVQCFKDATEFHWKDVVGSLPPMYDPRPRR